MTIQVALIETLVELGADVTWSSCNIFLQDHAQQQLHHRYSCYAWKGMNEEEFNWCIEQTLFLVRKTPKYDLDDGGDLTNLVLDHYPDLAKELRDCLKKQ